MVLSNMKGHPSSGTGGENQAKAKVLALGLLLGAALTEGLATLVADTLTLPITIPLDMARYPENYAKPKEPVVTVAYDLPPQYSAGASAPPGGDTPLPPGQVVPLAGLLPDCLASPNR
jgi:hypothetical protein